MKKIYQSFFFISFLLAFNSAQAQVTGIKNILVDYPSVQAAVAALNLQGVGAGGATINVPAGYSETFSVQVVLTITSNPSSQANPLVIRKSGAGPNPLMRAFTPGVSTSVDGIFILSGCDYVTIDGIDLGENPSNTTPTQLMEWGYALVKVSGTNGCWNNTVKNCVVTLSNADPASIGVYIGNHVVANTTGLTVSNISGTSSNNKFYNNTLQNCYGGYSFTGYNSAVPYDFYDQNNIIGVDGISSRRSQVVKFGGGSTQTNGIFATHQNNLKIHNTYINNSGAAVTTGTMFGILLTGGTNSNLDVYGDTITLSSNCVSGWQLTGISCAMGGNGAGNIININNNHITGCTYPTNVNANFRAIENTSTATYRSIFSNSITNNSIPGTGEFSCIYENNNNSTLMLSLKIHSNTISGNTKTGTAGEFYCINASASANQCEVYQNNVFNNSATASSGNFYGYYNAMFCLNETVRDNNIYNNTSGSGEHIGIYARTGPFSACNKEIYKNNIYNLASNSGTGAVGGIFMDNATVGNIHRNKIYNLTNNTTTGIMPALYGINIGTGSNNQCEVHNNFVSELKTPNANNINAIYGIWLQGSTASSIGAYFNTIYLDASSVGANFGTAALTCVPAPYNIDLRNNIAVNTSTPNGGGSTRAFVRITTALTNYNLMSGYNCLYAGTPGPANLLFYDGTNSVQTLQVFKNMVGPREQASFTEFPSFNNVATSPYDLHLANSNTTACESGGTPVGFLSVDIDFNARNATWPDVGADELVTFTVDPASPNIQYPLLTNSPVAPNKVLTGWATITDPSGVNTTLGTRPRLYYKKSSEANAYVGNTSANNGWKYVEATNASSPFNFNVNYALLFTGGNVVAGDVIQYFVTAQDLAAPINVGLNNGGFAVQPANVNLGAAQFPLGNTINQYTIVTNMYSGTLNVGPTETVTSLTNPGGMFDLINQGVLSGNTTLNITGDLTTETGAIALNQWSEDGIGNYSLTIQPSAATTRSITGSCTFGSLVRFNGADRVNIDGRFNNAGTWLLLRNTGQHSSVGYINDAQNNILQYSIIESGNQQNTNTGGGAVIIGTTSAMYGNDNITITNCEIRDRSDAVGNYPAVGINVSGTNDFLDQYNNNIVIKNNNIHDFFISGNSANGIMITTGVSYCMISANSLYQISQKSHTTVSGGSMTGISIFQPSALNVSGGFTITNNYIGGNAPFTAGSMTVSVVGPTVYQSFTGMHVSTGQILNFIEGNYLRGIELITNSPTVATNVFTGMHIGNGAHSVGTQTGNVIGAQIGTGAIKITINAGGAVNSSISGILNSAVNGNADIRNNSIGSISLYGTSTTGTLTLQWIQNQGTPVQAGNISNNLIGSISTPSSIVNNINAPTLAYGFRHQISTGAGLTALSNTIQNIADVSSSFLSQHFGMLMVGTVGNSGVMNVSNNLIKNISSNVLSPIPIFTNLGIVFQGMAGMHTVDANTISALSCVNTGGSDASIVGIQTQGGAFGGNMRRNLIAGFSTSQTAGIPRLLGICIYDGSSWEVSNNMISITNGVNTNNLAINGVVDYMGPNSNLNFHYNSIYIGGNAPGGNINTYGFYRGGTSNVSMRNNLLYNDRAGATASHVAIGTATSTNWSGIYSNYNALLTRDTTRLAVWSGTVTNFIGWKASSLGDNNSQKNITTSVTTTGLWTNAAAGDLHVGTNLYQGGLGTPISVTNDIDNNGRSATLPAVGADEMACPVPSISVSQTNILCFGGNNGAATITAIGGLNHTYSWSPVANTTNSITNQVASTHTVYVSNHCPLTGSLVINITQPTTITAAGSWTDVACFNFSTGIMAVNASGGTPGYTYSWTPSNATSSLVNNLPAGAQNYTVTDANGCKASGSMTISQPATPITAVGSSTSSCASQSLGAAEATVSGGTPGYTYSWTPAVSSWSTAYNIFPGTYTFQATDAAGCLSAPITVTVGTLPSPTVSAVTSMSVFCGIQTVTLTANASPNVTYYWSTAGTASTEVVTLGITTIYTVTVTYTNGCSADAYVTVSVVPCADLHELISNAEIQIFPNPSSGQLFVSYHGSTEGASVEVYNTLGQLMMKSAIESLTTEMNLNNYPNGVYIIKVMNAEGRTERATKLIKE